MKKSETLDRWRNLAPNADPLPHFAPIPYKSEGSSYGACGVRIDGSPAFVEAVLSNLKSLLSAENHVTRLELSRKRIEPTADRPCPKMARNAEVCYVRCHVRGNQGAMASAFFDRDLDEPTRRFAEAVGVS